MTFFLFTLQLPLQFFIIVDGVEKMSTIRMQYFKIDCIDQKS